MTATLRSTGETQTAPTVEDRPGVSRRRAMGVCSFTLLGAAGLAACGGGDSTSDSPTSDSAQTSEPGTDGGSAGGQTIAPVSEIAEGEAASFTLDGEDIIVAMPAAEQPVAFSATCPHQGGKVQVEGDQLVCPLHNSVFEKDTGAFVSGPADGQGLTPIEVSVEDGNIVTS